MSKTEWNASRREFLYSSAVLLGATTLRAQTRFAVAETASGKVRGIESEGIKIFKGIPYGAPTSGANRFMPPVKPKSWTGVRDALQYGATAPQRNPSAAAPAVGVSNENMPAEGEDCLVLNVWTPAVNDGRKRPVMFWCHGGGFATGSGSAPGTDGTNLAKRGDVVVVTVNHRLNVLGFTYLGKAGGADFESSGDAGMLDIVAALEWVRDNIERFGGDPARVMIFGQSGGGRKVATLLAMPKAKGLFSRAIIESGATLQLVERDQAARVGALLLDQLGLKNAQVRQIQQMPVERIMGAYFAAVKAMGSADQMTAGFSPMMDGKHVAQHPFHPVASPVSASVPVMLGTTRTEMTFQLISNPDDTSALSLNDAAMRGRIRELLADSTDSVIDVYKRANPGATPSDIFFLIASDYRYGAPVMKIAERRAALGAGPVYLYYFTWETPVQGGRLKSPHTMEIPFAFDNVKISARLTGGGPEAMALADKVSDAWIAFARTGDPNTGKLPRWTPFNAKDRPTMVINNQSKLVNDPIRPQREAMFRAMKLS